MAVKPTDIQKQIIATTIMMAIGALILWFLNLHTPTSNELREEGKALLRQEIIKGIESCQYVSQMNHTLTENGKLYFHCCAYEEPYTCYEQNGIGVSF